MSAPTIFDDIRNVQYDEQFQPTIGPDFCPTGFPPGSHEKIEVIRERVSKGQPLWHPYDPVDEILAQHEYASGIRTFADPRVDATRET